MEEAMHVARLVAVHSALLGLLDEFNAGQTKVADSVTVVLSVCDGQTFGFDVHYTRNGLPVGGEGAA